VDRWSRGDRTVTTILDGLADHGWLVMHDVETSHGRIEHVVVGPPGVFTVLTSERKGRISMESTDERTYAEPYAHARRVEAAISCKVTPVLVYSRAKLSRPMSRQRGVMVLTTAALADHLGRRRPRLTAAEVDSLHHQLIGMSWAPAPAAG